MTPGFYRMSDTEYHATDALSSTGIRRLLISPAHYKVPVEPTPAMAFGTAFHLAMLQPEEYALKYVVKPEGMSFATKEGKAWKAEHAESEILSFDDAEKIRGMCEAVRNCCSAGELLVDGEPELAGFWNDPVYGFPCKIKIDYLNKALGTLADLKKTTDARPEPFIRKAYSLGYHIQGAFYLYGMSQITKREHHDFYLIAVEDAPPHGVQTYKMSEAVIQEGLIQCQKAIEIYRQCMESGKWPCYPDERMELDLPRWAKQREPNIIIE